MNDTFDKFGNDILYDSQSGHWIGNLEFSIAWGMWRKKCFSKKLSEIGDELKCFKMRIS